MANCQECRERNATRGLLCDICYYRNQQLKERAKKMSQASTQRSEEPSQYRSSQGSSFGTLIKFMIFAGLIFGAYKAYPQLFVGRKLKVVQLTPPKTLIGLPPPADPCGGKRRCFIAFVAPWCSACHESIPFLQAIRRSVRKDADLGVQIVVGLDKQEQMQEMASELGGSVYFDEHGLLQQEMGVRGVPAWAVIDKERSLRKSGSGLPVGLAESDPQFNEYLKEAFDFF